MTYTGPRGEFPLRLRCEYPGVAWECTRHIPGVAPDWNRGLLLVPDAAEAVCKILDAPAPPVFGPAAKADTNLPLREYQREGAQFLADRDYAMLCYPPRAGKTLTSLAASQLLQSQRTLIICPAGARLVWRDEIKKWLGEDALLLYGRGGNQCRFANERNYRYLNKPTRGAHDEQAFRIALETARFTIINYELLQSQTKTDEYGGVYDVEHLPGWTATLNRQNYRLAIIDESHYIRGWKKGAKGKPSRRELVAEAIEHVQTAWGLTGTPVCSKVSDLWGQLQTLSGGLWGYKDTPFCYHTRYCAAHRGQYGWVDSGSSNVEELADRLKYIKLQPSRSEILPDMPPKMRQVIRIENETKYKLSGRGHPTEQASLAMAWTLKFKLPAIVDAVEAAILNGEKAIVYASRKASVEVLFKAFQKAKLRVFRGTSDDDCDAVAQKFRDSGPAVLVGTIDAWAGFRSLKGATSVHYAEYSFRPDFMVQSEDRPYEPGLKGLSVCYYVLENSIDVHIEKVLLPKVEEIAAVSDAEHSADFLQPFVTDTGSDSLMDVINAMMEDE